MLLPLRNIRPPSPTPQLSKTVAVGYICELFSAHEPQSAGSSDTRCSTSPVQDGFSLAVSEEQVAPSAEKNCLVVLLPPTTPVATPFIAVQSRLDVL